MQNVHKGVHFAPTGETFWEYFFALNAVSMARIKLLVFDWGNVAIDKENDSYMLRDRQDCNSVSI